MHLERTKQRRKIKKGAPDATFWSNCHAIVDLKLSVSLWDLAPRCCPVFTSLRTSADASDLDQHVKPIRTQKQSTPPHYCDKKLSRYREDPQLLCVSVVLCDNVWFVFCSNDMSTDLFCYTLWQPTTAKASGAAQDFAEGRPLAACPGKYYASLCPKPRISPWREFHSPDPTPVAYCEWSEGS